MIDDTVLSGRLKRWREDRGFGFIGTEDEDSDVFIHISALQTIERRPVVGDMIHYQIETDDEDGRKRAVNATIDVSETTTDNAGESGNLTNSPMKIIGILIFIVAAAAISVSICNKNQSQNCPAVVETVQ